MVDEDLDDGGIVDADLGTLDPNVLVVLIVVFLVFFVFSAGSSVIVMALSGCWRSGQGRVVSAGSSVSLWWWQGRSGAVGPWLGLAGCWAAERLVGLALLDCASLAAEAVARLPCQL